MREPQYEHYAAFTGENDLPEIEDSIYSVQDWARYICVRDLTHSSESRNCEACTKIAARLLAVFEQDERLMLAACREWIRSQNAPITAEDEASELWDRLQGKAN